MAKSNTAKTEAVIAKRLREGRGQGRKADYKPWLDVQQVPSLGLSERIKGWKSNRVHHLFSQLEVNYFYALEWSETVMDIREQYPLLPLDETLDIAQACGFTHPTAPRTTQPIVMTTDFLLTIGQSMGVTKLPGWSNLLASYRKREFSKNLRLNVDIGRTETLVEESSPNRKFPHN